MSEAFATPFTPDGRLTVDFAALLLLGRERGYLTPDDVMVVLESLELTPALIDAVIGRVRAEGIEWRDDGDPLAEGDLGFGVLPPETGSGGGPGGGAGAGPGGAGAGAVGAGAVGGAPVASVVSVVFGGSGSPDRWNPARLRCDCGCDCGCAFGCGCGRQRGRRRGRHA